MGLRPLWAGPFLFSPIAIGAGIDKKVCKSWIPTSSWEIKADLELAATKRPNVLCRVFNCFTKPLSIELKQQICRIAEGGSKDEMLRQSVYSYLITTYLKTQFL
jgi:hypothetical protein